MGSANTVATSFSGGGGEGPWATAAVAMGESNICCSGNFVTANYSVVMGQDNIIADGSGIRASSAFAVGYGNTIGHANNITADYAIAMGSENIIGLGATVVDASQVDVTGAFAVGSGNAIGWTTGERLTSVQYAIAMGKNNKVALSGGGGGAAVDGNGDYAIALGTGNLIGGGAPGGQYGGHVICAFAEGSGNIIGGATTANYAIAMGEGNYVGRAPYAFAQGKSNIIGNYVLAPHAIAMGSSNVVDASFGVAIGESNYAGATHAIAMGYDCSALGIASFADGSGCVAGDDYTVAMGAGATTSSPPWSSPAPPAFFLYKNDISYCGLDSAGDFHIAGNFIAASKTLTFVIPHPEHEGKMLRHACIEAPTRGTNIYEYQLEATESNQTTEIALPSYFKYINGRPRVYVSAENVFSACYGKVNEDLTHAIIKTEKPGVFNVLVTGVRKDPGAVKYAPSIYIDEPIAPEDIPPTQTVMGCGSNHSR